MADGDGDCTSVDDHAKISPSSNDNSHKSASKENFPTSASEPDTPLASKRSFPSKRSIEQNEICHAAAQSLTGGGFDVVGAAARAPVVVPQNAEHVGHGAGGKPNCPPNSVASSRATSTIVHQPQQLPIVKAATSTSEMVVQNLCQVNPKAFFNSRKDAAIAAEPSYEVEFSGSESSGGVSWASKGSHVREFARSPKSNGTWPPSCPRGHTLFNGSSVGGDCFETCDMCNEVVNPGDFILECKLCKWFAHTSCVERWKTRVENKLLQSSNPTFLQIQFQPGQLGIGFSDTDFGQVSEVHSAGQAHQQGVQRGWKIEMIDGDAYSLDRLEKKILGTTPYVATFEILPEQSPAQGPARAEREVHSPDEIHFADETRLSDVSALSISPMHNSDSADGNSEMGTHS